ncbi:MAG: hypothetical protein ACXWEF_06550 [Solirubrobacterales bacterium]
MRTKLQISAGATTALALTLLAAPEADGAVSVGQTAPGSTQLCGTGNSAQSAEAGPPSYVIPSPGVITAWQHKAHANGGDGRLLVWDGPPVSPLTLAGRSGVEVFTAGQLRSYPTRVPVSAGDVLGLRVHSMNAGCTFLTGAGDTAIARGGAPDIAPGESMTTTSTLPTQRVNVSATLEPDADLDGFGDETQDKCVGTAGTANGCPSTVTIDKLKQKGGKPKVKVTATVPGAGTLKAGSASDPALASAAAKTSLRPVTQTLISTTKQKVVLTLKLTKSAKRKLEDKGKLKAKVKVLYTPPGGLAGSQIGKVKLKS